MKHPYPINSFLRGLVYIWIAILNRRYRITANTTERIKKLNEPYLMLANHTGRYDPFIIGQFIKKQPNWISSDAILRDRVIGTMFKWLGAMPKKKGVRDSYIIREMAKVVQAGGSIGLFPEGARTWSGKSLDIDPSVAKLIRLLRIPVITAKMKGAYAYDPRWSKKIRKARVEIDYTYLIEKEDVRKLSEDEIMKRIKEHLVHDDIEYLMSQNVLIESDERAEYLNRVLYYCPDCESQSYFKSEGNTFTCLNCQQETYVNERGFFDRKDYSNTRDWIEWQNRLFVKDLNAHLQTASDNDVLLETTEMNIEHAVGAERMQPFGQGKLRLYKNRVSFSVAGKNHDFTLDEVNELSPQYQERLEMMLDNDAYRFTSIDIIEPGIKWEIAMNVIWAFHGSTTKLSAYYRDLVAERNEH